ncbi:hypothetical protein QUB47_02065 [Microcoleus sp. AT9_B5]
MCLITNSQQHDTDVTDTRIAVFSFLTPASRIPATRSIGPEIKNLYPMKLAERIYP